MAVRVPAMVLTKPKTLEARELACPAIGADDSLLRIEACGIGVCAKVTGSRCARAIEP